MSRPEESPTYRRSLIDAGRGHLIGSGAGRTRDRTWKCTRCQLVFASADQCGCWLCPSCCTIECQETFDVEAGMFTSTCGNCGPGAERPD